MAQRGVPRLESQHHLTDKDPLALLVLSPLQHTRGRDATSHIGHHVRESQSSAAPRWPIPAKPTCWSMRTAASVTRTCARVGSLSATGVADVEPFDVFTEDGWSLDLNPRFQNFPHETVSARMLAEIEDDLCLNCHPAGVLP